jgi:hypothetical protein
MVRGPSAVALWRTAVVVAVTDTTARMVSNNQMSFADYDNARLAVCQAQREGNDRELMRLLAAFCPGDPHIKSYPRP